jgi:hypothetical protein
MACKAQGQSEPADWELIGTRAISRRLEGLQAPSHAFGNRDGFIRADGFPGLISHPCSSPARCPTAPPLSGHLHLLQS